MNLVDTKITFPIKTIKENTLQVIFYLQFGDSFNLIDSYNSNELGLTVKSYGNIDRPFNLDDYLMTPSDFTIVLNFTKSDFPNLLDSEDFDNLTPIIELFIDGNSEFKGSYVDQTLEIDEGLKTIEFSFSSDSNKINEITLYKEDNTSINPLELNISGYNRITNNYEQLSRFPDLLLKIMQKVDPNIVLFTSHDWKFFSYLYPSLATEYLYYNVYVDNRWFFNDPTEDRILGDLLKSIARFWFSQIIIESNSKAVFRKLYYSGYVRNANTGEIYGNSDQSIGRVLSYKWGYKYHKIKYTVGKNLSNDSVYHYPNEDAYTEVSEDKAEFSQSHDVYFVPNPTGKYDYISYIKDPIWESEIQNKFQWMDLPAKLAFHYRGNKKFTKVGIFEIEGLHYSYSQTFIYNNKRFQIITMKKILAKGITYIEALNLGGI